MTFNTNTDRDLSAIKDQLSEIVELLKALQTEKPTPTPTRRKQK